jgi:hypothetical protein
MGHVNDYHGFVQLYPAGINRVPDGQGNKKRDITEVHSAEPEGSVNQPGGGIYQLLYSSSGEQSAYPANH